MAERRTADTDLVLAEVATELGLSHERARQLVVMGRLPGARRLGRWWVVPRSSVIDLKRQRAGKTVRAKDA